ncbi:MAG: MFS transporter [Rhodobacteraceae bacterium]|nr:MFS transporter [Paracoccaceae bacterium]
MVNAEASSGELKRGWPIIVAALVGTGTGISALPMFTIGVFTVPLGEAFGWSRAEAQGVISMFVLGALIGAPAAGWAMDRRGVRIVTLLSTTMTAILFFALAAFTRSLMSFYAIALVMGILGAGTTSVTWSRAIIAWFKAKRGLALGLALTGSGVCGAIVPIYATWLVQTWGWRYGYAGLGLLPAVLAIPVTLAFLRMPKAAAQDDEHDHEHAWGQTLGQAISTRRFWFIGIGLFLAGLGTSGVIAHLIPMLTDRGFSAGDAARIASALGIAILVGRVATGYLIDRIWAPAVAAVVLAIPAASCIILALDNSPATLLTLAAVAIGFAGGAEFDLLAYLCSRYFGLKHYGAIYGSLYACFVLASGMAPPLFGYVYDTQGRYDPILYIAAVAFVAGVLLLLALGRYPNMIPKPMATNSPT